MVPRYIGTFKSTVKDIAYQRPSRLKLSVKGAEKDGPRRRTYSRPNAPGGIPCHFWKARWKTLGSEYPSAYAVSVAVM
jgi:hypothetical protein